LIEPKAIAEMLCRMVVTTTIEDGVRVSTHVLYPSNSAVTVTVRGGTETAVISDDGGAITELVSSGVRSPISDRQIRAIVRAQGLQVKRGVISSPAVPMHSLAVAVVLVANASANVAGWALEHLRFQVRRTFRKDLEDLLTKHFRENLKHDTPILGASNKTHKFDYVIYLPKDKRLLIDPVINDHNSITSCVVANLDVRNAQDPRTEQLIVYDDRLRWNSADLKLLELGARTVPFSRAEPEIMRRAA
jgi:hypothetical protein